MGDQLDLGRSGMDIRDSQEKNDSAMIPRGFRWIPRLWACQWATWACGNVLEYRQLAQLGLTASGGPFACDTMNREKTYVEFYSKQDQKQIIRKNPSKFDTFPKNWTRIVFAQIFLFLELNCIAVRSFIF